MKIIKEIYGLSRTRDDKGNIVKRSLNQYVNTLHTRCGSSGGTMEILIVEVYEEIKTKNSEPR